MPAILPTPELVVCLRFRDIINQTKALEYGLNVSIPITDEGLISDYGKWTVGQAFNLTPDINEILDQCEARRAKDDKLEIFRKKEDCYSRFSIRKYFMQDFICYNLELHTLPHFHPQKIGYSSIYPWMIFAIKLDSSLDDARHIMFVVYTKPPDDPKNLPLYSRYFGEEVFKYPVDYSQDLKSNYFRINYEMTTVRQLEAPYDTNCVWENGSAECIRDCLISRMRKIGRVPDTEIITEPVDLKPQSQFDLDDPILSQEILAIYQDCNSSCLSLPCSYSFCSPYVRGDIYRPNDTQVWIDLMTPNGPVITIESLPVTDLIEFLVYMLSCFSIWFGLSFVSFQPKTLVSLWKPSQNVVMVQHRCLYQHHYCNSMQRAQQ